MLLDHEISIEDFNRNLREGKASFVLDVRETWECIRVHIEHDSVVNIPVSTLMGQNLQQLEEELPDKNREFYVLCHHGIRSERITRWLRSLGWSFALSVAGGIDRYALVIDPSVGYY